jgi:hypothetical protein
MGRTDAEHIVALLSKHAARAQASAAAVERPESSLHWPSVAALVLPALLLTIIALA